MPRVEEEDRNKRVVTDLYKALISKDTNTLHRLLAPDLEWWFHGPPCHRHHLIPFLTDSSASSSSSSSSNQHFVPDLIVGFGSVVIAEGYDDANMVWWVHAWTATIDGVITQVREYLNTSVTVTRLEMLAPMSQNVGSSDDDDAASNKCQSIWKSTVCDESVPGLILAI